jgi:scyllo-inositol 2-dehydrogenase (NADP+)
LRQSSSGGRAYSETEVETVRGSWDAYYENIADHLAGRAPLAVTAEQAREVVRVLDAATRSAAEHQVVEGPWGG